MKPPPSRASPGATATNLAACQRHTAVLVASGDCRVEALARERRSGPRTAIVATLGFPT